MLRRVVQAVRVVFPSWLLRLFLILTACLFVALWIRSQWRYDQLSWGSSWLYACFDSSDGAVRLLLLPDPGGSVSQSPSGWKYFTMVAPEGADEGIWSELHVAEYRRLEALGLGYQPNVMQRGARTTYFTGHRLYLPHWLLAFLCLAWPVTSFVIARRRRRTRGFEVEPSQRAEVGTAKHGVVKDEG